jgi:hypothetical protein
MLAWDDDLAFEWSNNLLRHIEPDYPKLFGRAYNDHAEMREVFLSMVEKCANSALEDNWLANEIERLITLVGPTVIADTNKPILMDSFDQRITTLRGFAGAQPQYALKKVAELRGQ